MRPLLLLLLALVLGCGPGATWSAPESDGPQVALVLPLGDVAAILVDSVAAALRREHGVEVRVGEPKELPRSAFTTLRTPRYRADSLIAWLRKDRPQNIDFVIGLTREDISITKRDASGAIKEPASKYQDFGIYGLGYIGGPSCVVSTFRLGSGPLFHTRLAKIATHELGHVRGLQHCMDTTCVMRDAVERMSTIDAASSTFCETCARRLDQGGSGP